MKLNLIRVNRHHRSRVKPQWWVVLVVLFFAFAGFSYWQVKHDIVQEREQLTASLSHKLLAPMALNDSNYAQDILNFLKDQPRVVSARLADVDGALVASFDSMGQGENFALMQLNDGRVRFDRSELLMVSPIKAGNQVLGHIHLRLNTSPSFVDAFGTTIIVFGLMAMGLLWMHLQGAGLSMVPRESLHHESKRSWQAPDQAIHDALEQAGISMRYVPITDVETGGLRGVEAVVHWARPSEMPVHVSTAEFIGLAEKNDLILPFEDWALKTALSQVANWYVAHGSLALSFNITAKQFNSDFFPRRVRDLCRDFGLPLQAVSLEIHESVMAHMTPTQLLNIQVFERQGLPLTIDGFGSTSHAHNLLQQTTLAAVKFDYRLLVQSEHEDVLSERVQELANLAKTQQIALAAEGVCSGAQERAVGLLGCATYQGMGYYQSLASNTLDAILLSNHDAKTAPKTWRNSVNSDGSVSM